MTPADEAETDNSPQQLPVDSAYSFDGYIDFHGYHPGADGWFAGGWIAYPWPPGQQPETAIAVFGDRSLAHCTRILFYHREDLKDRAIGFVLFFPAATTKSDVFLSALMEVAGVTRTIYPAQGARPNTEAELVGFLRPILAGGAPDSGRQEMLAFLRRNQSQEPVTGRIDRYGYLDNAGGWLLGGWISHAWPDADPPDAITLSFDDGDLTGESFVTRQSRDDRSDGGVGIVVFVSGPDRQPGRLSSVSFPFGGERAVLHATPAMERLTEPDLRATLSPLIKDAAPGPHRDVLAALTARWPYRGEDTLSALSPAVFLHIDEAIRCGSSGLALMGWYLCASDEIRAIRVRSGSSVSLLEPERCIRVDRPDVIEAHAHLGFNDPACGFIAWLPNAVVPGATIYIEVETVRRQIGYRNVPSPKLEGIGAIKRLLSEVDVRFNEVRPAFDKVLGPAVEALNKTRLARPVEFETIDYGSPVARPRFSVIVPVHGRLDFVEYQQALLSAHPRDSGVEFIYVLDDPPKRREARRLFPLIFERFRVPFKAVLLDRNVGYAPASNIGLGQARGRFVAFVNSDVFPGTPDWLERLSRGLTGKSGIGAIAPMLLFEDGSVQHRGMAFTRLPEFGNWHFGMHVGKGARPAAIGSLETHDCITGACVLMTRSLAREIGGFDESYVIGDFEDCDLSLRLRDRGYQCVVDPSVQLWHLERKSQASSSELWRMNLTLYNAWQHDRRWGAAIDAARASLTS